MNQTEQKRFLISQSPSERSRENSQYMKRPITSLTERQRVPPGLRESHDSFQIINKEEYERRTSEYMRAEDIPKFRRSSGPVVDIDCLDNSCNNSHAMGPTYSLKQATQSQTGHMGDAANGAQIMEEETKNGLSAGP